MFRRPTRTAENAEFSENAENAEAPGSRATHRRRSVSRARRRQAVDDAALRARLDRMNRRLAEVGSVQVTARAYAIDNDTARRDPLTRPFSAPVDGSIPRRRVATAPLPHTA